jgi:monoamine oxidase
MNPSFSPSGRTPLFRAVARALAKARFLAAHPELGGLRNELSEIGAGSRRGDAVARRDFLRTAAKLGIALPVAGSAIGRSVAHAAPRAASRSADPVAIIGAGAAGLTAAYRLMKAGVPCEIFEASARVGGRIFTLPNFTKEGQFCELGAELVDTNHEDLIALAAELTEAGHEVKIQELKDGDAGVELYHFEGKIFTEKDLLPKFEGLAKAIAEDQAKLYEGEDEDYTDHARALDKMSIAQYLESKKDTTEKWVLDMLNIAYTGEYGLDTDRQTALNLLTYIDPDTSAGFKIFGESDESKRVQGGNSTLMNALAAALEGKVKIHSNHWLTKIEDTGSAFNLTFGEGAKAKTVTFARVLVAIPFTILRQVEGLDKLALSPEKLAAIKTLGYGTNVKVMYGFTEKTWRTPGTGRPECNGSMYTSNSSQCFWETSRKQPGKGGILTNYRGGTPGTFEVNDALRETTLAHLDQIVPGSKAKHDKELWRSWVWPTYRFSQGAYSCPLVGQLTTVWEATGTPELDGRLLFAGEHTSADFGGFMNGAIQTGNVAASLITTGG